MLESHAVTRVADQARRVDILVDNAGYLGDCCPFEKFEPVEWQRILQVNLIGVFELTRQVLPDHAPYRKGAHRQYGPPCRQGGLAKTALHLALGCIASNEIITMTDRIGEYVSLSHNLAP